MFQLTYISTARNIVSEADVDLILAVSRTNNARDGLSGLLVYDGVRFLQALEGERDRVCQAFERIKADHRHIAAVTLSAREIADRQFGTWSMACERVCNLSGAVSVPQAISMPQIVDTLVSTVKDPNTRALFSSFARLDRQSAA